MATRTVQTVICVLNLLILSASSSSSSSPTPSMEPRQQQPVMSSRSASIVPPYDINPYFGFRKYGEMRYEPLGYEYVRNSGLGGLLGQLAGGYPAAREGSDGARAGRGIPQAALREVHRWRGQL